jgi:tRNA threonylcarbamoyladenosine biosynthesis protein TsaB
MILSLDTSAAAGSVALLDNGRVVIERAGDPSRTHGARLPAELMAVLAAVGATLGSVDLFAVSVGPGSFTGLRVGIATMQGLALANAALVVPVTTFEALAWHAPVDVPVAVWIDAHRSEVFASLIAADRKTELRPASALSPRATLEAWTGELSRHDRVRFVGDGAVRYQDDIRRCLGSRAEIAADVPPLAGAIADIAYREPTRAVRPHAIVPVYVRRPDAELARDRRSQA